jgi:hypothetical protein
MRLSLGYEQYDGRLQCLGSSPVVALTSVDGWRPVADDLARLPRLGRACLPWQAVRLEDGAYTLATSLETCVIGPVLVLVLAVAIGIAVIWNIGGVLTRMRARLNAMPLLGATYGRLPSWVFRAFGV